MPRSPAIITQSQGRVSRINVVPHYVGCFCVNFLRQEMVDFDNVQCVENLPASSYHHSQKCVCVCVGWGVSPDNGLIKSTILLFFSICHNLFFDLSSTFLGQLSNFYSILSSLCFLLLVILLRFTIWIFNLSKIFLQITLLPLHMSRKSSLPFFASLPLCSFVLCFTCTSVINLTLGHFSCLNNELCF